MTTTSFFFGDDFFDSDDRYDAQDRRFFGCCVALVTNNKDPEGMGRVRVRFPWLDQATESHWARVMQIMTGDGRGWWNLPEVEDEVIVAFEHGDVHFPYVIGHVWNGKDRPPGESLSNVDGKNDIRMYESRSGHRLVFDDAADAAHVRLVDRTGKNYIRLWNPQNKVEIVATDGDQYFKAPNGKIQIIAKNLVVNVKANATKTAGTEYSIQTGENLAMESKGAVTMKAGANWELKADKTTTMKVDGGLSMKSSMTNILGTDTTSIKTDGAFDFLSLILLKIGVGTYSVKAPIIGIKTLIAQITNGGDQLDIGAKIVSFDGLKIRLAAGKIDLVAKMLALIKAGTVNLNVGAPELSGMPEKGHEGFLAKLKGKLARLRAKLEALSKAIADALGLLPSFLRDLVSKYLKDALKDLFGFLPDVWRDALVQLLSGGGVGGPLGDLLNGLTDTDYAKAFAEFETEELAAGAVPTIKPEPEMGP
jgi:phage baseplate assembly protein gpV